MHLGTLPRLAATRRFAKGPKDAPRVEKWFQWSTMVLSPGVIAEYKPADDFVTPAHP
jgi:hypothetical protein